MIKKLLKFFDKTEDKVREILSRYVILYAFIGGVAIVLFWRGVWKIADGLFFMTGVMSVIISSAILLLTGLFVSFFIGDRIILSGLKKEKKLAEKTEEEIKSELERSIRIIDKLEKIEKDLEEVKNKIK
ncbi:MAG: hypothetical protein US71_C0001G0108 [Parcubacteria group bacterium GW2011_GWD2_38_12]|nr:MAG: hypothetical protein US06_C0002G0020 [Parcubacteria group bacterium GW2011_GWC2_36_17]KKQ42387.1 MAG: hypothetical protein US61_C0027G0016 [Parcubacteria group bacterium GW2011_GWE2_37_8]KKQ52905.1 MAG: hypothetical protein US71_C0001G0108 [Parcubacteria group bacterium GW2011_GWD2_38_12]KKQ59108.1 MAG: hypothetical protein US79_C0001G0107 [Parcubacteria group bacterium GW2011_GWC1_38_17]KKQ59723.1 MAG: hypothetical protein US78_C0001G0083 [Parcubacteria group bacterium GW2011_GWD1_38_1